MSTVRDRQNFLRQRVIALADEIEGTEYEAAVVELGERLRNGESLPATPTDGEWDLLLPTERDNYLPAYFLSLRAELVVLQGDGVEARKRGRLTEWLDGPIPKVLSIASVLVSLGTAIGESGFLILRSMGLAYSEDGSTLVDADALD